MVRISGGSTAISRWPIDMWRCSWSIRGQNIYANTRDKQKRIVNWKNGSTAMSLASRRCGIFFTRTHRVIASPEGVTFEFLRAQPDLCLEKSKVPLRAQLASASRSVAPGDEVRCRAPLQEALPHAMVFLTSGH